MLIWMITSKKINLLITFRIKKKSKNKQTLIMNQMCKISSSINIVSSLLFNIQRVDILVTMTSLVFKKATNKQTKEMPLLLVLLKAPYLSWKLNKLHKFKMHSKILMQKWKRLLSKNIKIIKFSLLNYSKIILPDSDMICQMDKKQEKIW